MKYIEEHPAENPEEQKERVSDYRKRNPPVVENLLFKGRQCHYLLSVWENGMFSIQYRPLYRFTNLSLTNRDEIERTEGEGGLLWAWIVKYVNMVTGSDCSGSENDSE